MTYVTHNAYVCGITIGGRGHDTPSSFFETPHISYDREKYRDMLLEAAETLLSYFGFDRAAFGEVSKRNKKWWH